MKPTHAQMVTLAEYIVGTCNSIGQATEACGLGEFDDSDFENELLNHDVEMCGVCNWWCEVCELEFDEAANHGVCSDCR